ncbi:MAG: NUDIX domain-containing protein [Chloroflexi bacterium]|nr:MAG: NUDIX domain-containing protein [Chloroflexota bacterium]
MSTAGHLPRMTVCVGAVVLQGDQALFVRQAPGHPLEGQWSIPWGIVEAPETPEAAALRETWEEGGIRHLRI